MFAKLIRSIYVTLKIWQFNLKMIYQYKASLITSIITTIINNGIYILFWFIFFLRFGESEGFNFRLMMLTFGLISLSFGMVFFFFGNIMGISLIIQTGQYDYYLKLPIDSLSYMLTSNSNVGALGDIIFGIIAIIFTAVFGKISVFIPMLVICSAINIVSFLVLVSSTVFILGDSQSLINTTVSGIMTTAVYPEKIFPSPARIILYTLIPAGIISFLPINLIVETNVKHSLIYLGITIILFLISRIIFYLLSKFYESGNISTYN